MKDDVVRRVVPMLCLVLLVGGIIYNQHIPGPTADAWLHLRIGHEFLGPWTIANPGNLGAFDSASWIPTQWAPQMAMAWLGEHFGVAGVIWITGALSIILVPLVYASCRHLAAPLPAALATCAALIAGAQGLSARPQLLSFLLIAITTSAWLATSRDGRPRYWIIALAWLWPMVHGLWPVGISISVAAVVGLAMQRTPRRALLRMACIPAASLVVAGLTPLGLDVFRSLFVAGSRSVYFAEWGPPDFTSPSAAVLAVTYALVAAVEFRSPNVDWVRVTFFLLALGWGFYSLRTTPVAALIVAPLLAGAIQRAMPSNWSMAGPERLALLGTVAAGLAAMVVVANLRTSETVVPAWVDGRLDALPAGTRVLNDWDTGSYFVHRHADLDFAMHGYGDVFTDDELERNVDLLRLRPGWDDRLAAMHADVALMDSESALGYALQSQLSWTVVEADSEFTLLTAPTATP